MNKLVKIIYWLAVFVVSTLFLFWLALVRPSLPNQKQLDVEVDTNKLHQHVKVLSEEYVPRSYLDIDKLNAAADYIKLQFEQYGHRVEEQIFTVNNIEFRNLIVNLGPSDGPKLVIGAHYDAAGPFPGADDNASGVAGLIELSQLLTKEKLNKPVTLVAYAQEEPPFYATRAMGSFVHAKSEKSNNSDIDLMVSLEMIGYFSDQDNTQFYPLGLLKLFYPDKGNFVAVIDQLLSNQAFRVKNAMKKGSAVPVYSMNAPRFIPGVDFSDHRNYWAHGYDAVMVTDTAFYRNMRYHTPEDKIEYLNFEKMAEVVKGVYAFVRERDKHTP